MEDIERRKVDQAMTDQAVAVAEAFAAMIVGMDIPAPLAEYGMQIALVCSAAKLSDTPEQMQARLALMGRNMSGMSVDIWRARLVQERAAAEAEAAGHA